jgi:hypothetical protein
MHPTPFHQVRLVKYGRWRPLVKHELFENHTHSFIVKVWLERTAAERASQVTWRGHITHVPSGERRYLKDLNEVIYFIGPYLEEMGAKFTTRGWLRSYLNQILKYLRSIPRFRRAEKTDREPSQQVIEKEVSNACHN